MNNMFDLTGRNALLTGASRGMGLEMAKGLAQQGANVVISARKIEALEAATAEINDAVGRKAATPMTCNIGNRQEVEALAKAARESVGPISVLIGNAGVNPFYGSMRDITDEAFEKTMQANVQSNLWLANAVFPDMEGLGGGSMLFTSSVGAFKPSDTLGTYNISKLALIALVRNLAMEMGPAGVRVNALCPGVVKTEFARALWDNPKIAGSYLRQVPLRRLGEPEDFTGIAAFMASDASRYITGQALTVDGGAVMWT
ncbi:SDR family NAD(P)-dependent oxidoreductase [Ruegeria sp. HKCCA5426]|uniref:SDR family NAD(P)-dependent oxidoreductase n=1 Tax=Ruegeria sp. HKCCA5426 TaxID=2682985 RepID=UPI001489D683|nr:glucose 1-dehydrogenase [Ruegeria sp. HKCCA5426]